MYARNGSSTLGGRGRRSRSPTSHARTVLRSRPVCRAIALIDQPRRYNATISTTSSRDNIQAALLASTASSTANAEEGPGRTPPLLRLAYGSATKRGLPDQDTWGISMSTSEESD